MMEYTKGEWRIDTESIATVVMGERTKVAVVYGYTDEEELANAYLIAAAPAMFEALKADLKALEGIYSAAGLSGIQAEEVKGQIEATYEALAEAKGK